MQLAAGGITREFAGQFPELSAAVDLGIDPSPLVGRSYDLVIGQSWPNWSITLFEFGLHFRYLALLSLSSISSGEALWGVDSNADALLFQSEENRDYAGPSIVVPKKRQHVLRNALAAEWFAIQSSPAASNGLRTIRTAIITNHLVPEVSQLPQLLSEKGFSVEVIGKEGSVRLVDPAYVDSLDLIITIGHSVQKALSRGIAVFCYDRFGGPGYLFDQNLRQKAEYFGFSGRCSNRRLAAEALVQSIEQGYDSAKQAAPLLRNIAQQRYRLTTTLAAIIRSFKPDAGLRSLRTPQHRGVRKIMHYCWNQKGSAIFPELYPLWCEKTPVVAVMSLRSEKAGAHLGTIWSGIPPFRIFGGDSDTFDFRFRVRIVGDFPEPRVFAKQPNGSECAIEIAKSIDPAKSRSAGNVLSLSGRASVTYSFAGGSFELHAVSSSGFSFVCGVISIRCRSALTTE